MKVPEVRGCRVKPYSETGDVQMKDLGRSDSPEAQLIKITHAELTAKHFFQVPGFCQRDDL